MEFDPPLVCQSLDLILCSLCLAKWVSLIDIIHYAVLIHL